MMREAERWLNQAKNDLEAAKWNSEGKFYAHACFLSQQAAEKALKAYLYSIGLPDSIPSEVYLKQDAQVSINHSEKVLDIVSKLVKI
jgi:HEPN domain-containing protein